MRPIQVAVLYFDGTGQGLPACMGRASTVKCGDSGMPGIYAEYWPHDREFYVEHLQANEIKVFMVPRETCTTWEPKCGREIRNLLGPKPAPMK